MAGALRRMVGWKLAGAAAGAAGTVAMDLLWYQRARARQQEPGSFVDWETAKGLASFDDAPAPAQVVRVAAQQVLGSAPDDRYARTATNVMHWTTGVAWAAAAGLVAGALGARNPLLGLPFGAAVWSASYATLVPLDIYRWPWEYDARTVVDDLTAHLVYGAVAGLVWWGLSARR